MTILTTPDLVERLRALDLSMVKTKLQDPEEGAGWASDYCDRIEDEYRRFLELTGRYPDRPIVPSKIVDSFWHAHILDTQAYAEDSAMVFGFFLHHFPYFGMRGPETLPPSAMPTTRPWSATTATSDPPLLRCGHAPAAPAAPTVANAASLAASSPPSSEGKDRPVA